MSSSQSVHGYDNPLETLVHYLLIGGMTCHGHQDGFTMVSLVVCMITHWIELMMNHDIYYQVVIIH